MIGLGFGFGGGGLPAAASGTDPAGIADRKLSLIGDDLAAGATAAWADQSGEGNDFAQAVGALQPVRVAGPNGHLATSFTGVDLEYLEGPSTAGIISASAFTMWVVCYLDSTWTALQSVVADAGGFFGLFVADIPEAQAYVFDGGAKIVGTAIATLEWTLITMRLAGGTLYVAKNGGAEAPLACGNVGGFSTMRVGTVAAYGLDAKIARVEVTNTDSPDRVGVNTWLKNWAGIA